LSTAPVYQQLLQSMRSMLQAGNFAVGSRFPSERQIADRYGVSRATANKVLSTLVSESALEFRKGIGTFVSGRSMDYNLRALVSFTEEATAAGKRPATRLLKFEQVSGGQVPDEILARLRVGMDDYLIYMERLRFADGRPVILEKRHVVAAHCPGLTESDARGSLYSAWKNKFHLTVEAADQTIRAVSLHGADAHELRIRDGAAGMLVRCIGYLAGERPLWFERTLYRGDAYEFRNRLTGIQSGQHACGRFLATALREER
jgi:GntR family transcriptional regulator